MAKKIINLHFHVDEETGKIEKVTGNGDSSGEGKAPEGTITDSVSIVVTKKNPICFSVQINGVWYTYCY